MPVNRGGRPKHDVICDQLPGRIMSMQEAADLAGVGYHAIPAAIRRGRPTGKNRLVFRKANAPGPQSFPDGFRMTSNGYEIRPGDPEYLERAFQERGEEAAKIVFGKGYREDECLEVLGIPVGRDFCFEDIEAAINCIVALILVQERDVEMKGNYRRGCVPSAKCGRSGTRARPSRAAGK